MSNPTYLVWQTAVRRVATRWDVAADLDRLRGRVPMRMAIVRVMGYHPFKKLKHDQAAT